MRKLGKNEPQNKMYTKHKHIFRTSAVNANVVSGLLSPIKRHTPSQENS